DHTEDGVKEVLRPPARLGDVWEILEPSGGFQEEPPLMLDDLPVATPPLGRQLDQPPKQAGPLVVTLLSLKNRLPLDHGLIFPFWLPDRRPWACRHPQAQSAESARSLPPSGCRPLPRVIPKIRDVVWVSVVPSRRFDDRASPSVGTA